MPYSLPDLENIPGGIMTVGVAHEGVSGTPHMSTTDTRAGIVFRALRSENMTGFRTYTTSISGTVTNIARADLYAVDDNGLPTGASLGDATFTPVTNNFINVTWGTPYALTSGTCYCVLIRNTDAAPATNRWYQGVLPSDRIPPPQAEYLYSTDAGVAWVQSSRGRWSPVFAPIYATSNIVASLFPHSNNSAACGFAEQLYNTSGSRIARVGIKVNFPVRVRLHRVIASIWSGGGTTGNIIAEVCNADSVLSVADTKVDSSVFVPTMRYPVGPWDWVTPYTLEANTDYYVCIRLENATSGDSANYVSPEITNAWIVKPASFGIIRDAVYSTGTSISWTSGGGWTRLSLYYSLAPNTPPTIARGLRGGYNA